MQKTPGKTPAARDKYWTKIIQEARKYPKGITEYCRVMNISKNNYYFWFKRLRSKHTTDSRSAGEYYFDSPKVILIERQIHHNKTMQIR